jgi:putative transport protein
MEWLIEIPQKMPIAYTVLVLMLVAMSGLALGSIKVRGISLGIAGVLFAGLILGHFKLAPTADPKTVAILDFVRDFGLILFVYTIGMQVGPGFLTSLRQQGLPLNILALSTVLLGAAVTLGLSYLLNLDIAAAVGLFAGATTNTPALAAAQEALKSFNDIPAERAQLPAIGYAVAYPLGVLGVIMTMLLLRAAFRIDTAKELEEFQREQKAGREALQRMNILVDNKNLNSLQIRQIPGLSELGIVVSRIRQAGQIEVRMASPDTVIHCGDVIHAVGTAQSLESFRLIVGRESPVDLRQIPSQVTYRRFVVTNKEILGRTIGELDFPNVHGVTVTRVTRADIEMTAVPDLKLQFGDMLQLVGDAESLNEVSKLIGNSVKELNHTNLIPIFIGIALGVLAGCYPISFSGIPAPVRLGLAGGPLIVAILLSRLGRLGPLVWYMPTNANILLRELGITLFLACVGLKAGEKFFHVLVQGPGLQWMAFGALITLLPIIATALIGRLFMKLRFITLCGLMAGSMTDPPALAFANAVNNSDAPSVAYATVYPFTMLLRIVAAQLIVLLFFV